jgi:hypothetical protein
MKTLALLLSAAALAACDRSPPVDDSMGCAVLAGNNYGVTNRVVSAHHVGWLWRCEVELPDRLRDGVWQYSRHMGLGTWENMSWK